MPKTILWITHTGDGIGMVRELIKRGNAVFVLPIVKPSYGNFTIVGGDGSLEHRIAEAFRMARNGKFDYGVMDMVGALPRPVTVMGHTIKTIGQLAQLLSHYIRGINIFPYSAAAEALELEREAGVDMAAAVGMKVPHTEKFDKISDGIKFLQEHSDQRWVFKPNSNEITTFVGKSAEELIFQMEHIMHVHGDKLSFILQEFVEGVEVDIEGWFVNGQYLEGSANITLETKKFMTGDMGITTGCATTVQKAISENSRLFKETLERYFNILRRWMYTGAFSVTTIVSRKDKKPYFLENCARMGYTAMYALLELYDRDVEKFFDDILSGKFKGFSSGFAYGVRVTIAPYPFTPSSPYEENLYRKLVRSTARGSFVYGEKAARQKQAFVWWADVAPTGKILAGEPVYEVRGDIICEVTASHETDILKAQERAEEAVKALSGQHLQARLGDGGQIALKRWQTLVNWGLISTKEREEK